MSTTKERRPAVEGWFTSDGLVGTRCGVCGTPYFPPLEDRINLELIETRTFGSRVVYARYRRA